MPNCSVSVVIPMFNAEKFGGRLTLAHMEKIPAAEHSRATKACYFRAGNIFSSWTPTTCSRRPLSKNFTRSLKIFSRSPTLEPKDLEERVQEALRGRYEVRPWQKLVRRDLMMEHEIFFPHVSIGEDDVWTFGLVFYAEKFLRLPDAVYFYRANEEGVWQKNKTPEKQIIFWTNPILFGLKTLDKFMSKIEFFQKNLRCRYAVLEKFITSKILDPHINKWHLPPFEIYEAIKKEFGDKLGEQDVLVSALCTCIMTLQKNYYESVQKFNRFAAQAQQRITQLEAELVKRN